MKKKNLISIAILVLILIMPAIFSGCAKKPHVYRHSENFDFYFKQATYKNPKQFKKNVQICSNWENKTPVNKRKLEYKNRIFIAVNCYNIWDVDRDISQSYKMPVLRDPLS
jgi:hypothetical protein